MGEDHQDTLISLTNLGLFLRKRATWGGGKDISRSALDLSRRVKGDNHPDTLYVINNMGTLMIAEDKFDEAEAYLREAHWTPSSASWRQSPL